MFIDKRNHKSQGSVRSPMSDTPHRAPLERVVSFRFRAINIWPRGGQHLQPKQHTVTHYPILVLLTSENFSPVDLAVL